MVRATVKRGGGGAKTGAPVRLESARLSYQSPPPITYAGEIAGWFEDPEVGRYIGQPLTTVQQAERAISNTNNSTRFFFGAFLKGTPTIIGFTQVRVTLRHRRGNTVSAIGDRAYWGGGRYAMEMRAAVLDFLFRTHGLNKVESYVYARNFPSIFNNKALGYTCEGILRQQEVGPDGEYRDLVYFGILREEWLSRERQQTPSTA